MDVYDNELPDRDLDPRLRGGSPERLPLADEYVGEPRPVRRRILLPAVLFVATCASTYQGRGLAFAAALMFILTTHELGHFIQAVRYRVPTSLPIFLPMPFSPIGTMGAVIAMQAHVGNRKALYDIGISGPLAGLVPALACSIIGLRLSEVVPVDGRQALSLGEPLLFKLLSLLTLGPLDESQAVFLHPLAYAGWVGIFITGLNLIPIGQLDGGHVLYALLLRRAHRVATFMLFAAVVAVAVFGYWGWSVMLLLLFLMGAKHPPTADDNVPLGTGRIILGWLTLAFVVVGFTPQPFYLVGR
ncbi:MAG TPA: site-2 protease family protein [Pirellulales bacterium]|nr:site-2 protease family protein [Pirellulales bacterium]